MENKFTPYHALGWLYFLFAHLGDKMVTDDERGEIFKIIYSYVLSKNCDDMEEGPVYIEEYELDQIRQFASRLMNDLENYYDEVKDDYHRLIAEYILLTNHLKIHFEDKALLNKLLEHLRSLAIKDNHFNEFERLLHDITAYIFELPVRITEHDDDELKDHIKKFQQYGTSIQYIEETNIGEIFLN